MRQELAGRPLVGASLALAAGISSILHPINVLFLAALLILCRGRITALVFICGGFLVGLLLAPTGSRNNSEYGDIVGTISSVPTLVENGQTFLLSTRRETLLARVYGNGEFLLGETVRVNGKATDLSNARYAGISAGGVSQTVSVGAKSIEVLQSAPIWFVAADRWRSSFLSSTNRALEPRQAALVNALCFASSGDISQGTKDDLSRTGVAHVLSVSGLQVFLLAWLVLQLLSVLPLRRSLQIIVVALLLALYATATGLHPATVRAVVIALLTLSAYLVRREPDLLSALGLAAILTLMWQPWSLFTPGFQFSYVVVGALAMFWQRYGAVRGETWWERFRRRAMQVVSMSFVATLAVAPLTAYHFGVVSVASPVANLLVGPVTPLIVCVSMLAWGIGMFAPSVQLGLMKLIVSPFASWILWVTRSLGEQGWSAISWPQFNPYWMVLYYGAFLLLWYKKWRPRRDSNPRPTA